MAAIALVGADGAGKTTMARMLEKSSMFPLKYLYMGINIESSNVALPTSRLITYLRRTRDKKSNTSGPQSAALQTMQNCKRKPAGKLWAAARLAHRLAEEWYRQLLSWSYQMRGYIVVYDRHFLFDFPLHDVVQNQPLSEWLHRWCLASFYPQPDLVLYLDAPAEVLFARKGESTLQYLTSRRQAFTRQGKHMPNFVYIDATQPLGIVYAEVTKLIIQFYEKHYGSTTSSK